MNAVTPPSSGMPHMKRILALVLLAAIAHPVNAQTPLKPGDRIIRYDWIKPSHSYYRNVISDSAGNVKYDFMMEDYTTVDQQKKQVIFARQRQIPAGYVEADTSVTDLHLKPVSMHEVHTPQNVSFEMTFADTLASVATTRAGKTSTMNYPMQSGYFEDNMIGYIWGYLELEKGIVYRIDNFNKDARSPSDPYTLEYAFDDVSRIAPDRELFCTVLRFTHGGTSGYIWIDKSTHATIKVIGRSRTGSYFLTRE
jgi:hypothetical protein